jgi:hypothetical protein
MTKAELVAEYRPYDTMPEFQEGWDDYMGQRMSLTKHQDGVAGQAYDRGLEAAMRWRRMGR